MEAGPRGAKIHHPAWPPRRVARLTRKEWAIRVVAIMVALSFFGGIFMSFFSSF